MQLINLSETSLLLVIGIFGICGLVIAVAGTYLTKYGDQIADRTGIGEALTGAVLLGGFTSLPGIIATVTAAANNYPELAVSNAVGGIAAQTSFLAIADISYKKANLEHAAASLGNMMSAVLLITLLSIVLLIDSGPDITVWNIHPGVLLIPLVYLAGMKLADSVEKSPMWSARRTAQTVTDIPKDEFKTLPLVPLITKFLFCALLVGASGYLVAKAGIELANRTMLSEVFVGALFTAVVTSLPELVVSVSSVRQGSVTMAVSNVVGGNCFDVLFIVIADFFFLKGSILHATSKTQNFIITLTILMITVLLMGLLHRQKEGIGKIGWESLTILLLFLGGYVILYFMG